MPATPPAPTILADTVRRALSEDIDRGDITTEACVSPTATGTAALHARERLVVCGLPILEEVYGQVDPLVDVDALVTDGDEVQAGSEIAILSGPAASILLGERVALNFIQRLSGVSTMTRRFDGRSSSWRTSASMFSRSLYVGTITVACKRISLFNPARRGGRSTSNRQYRLVRQKGQRRQPADTPAEHVL